MRESPVSVPACSTGAPSATLSAAAVSSGSTTVRPDEPGYGPSPANTPTTRTCSGAPAPSTVSAEPTSSPSSAANRSVIRAAG